MKSFSKTVKEELSSTEIRNKLCCKFSFIYGAIAFLQNAEADKITFSTNAENALLIKTTLEQIKLKKDISFVAEKSKISIESDIVRYFTIAEIVENVFKCQHCRENFLKGVFLSLGSVSDPEKSYRLDLVFNHEIHAKQILELLSEIGCSMKISIRSNKFVLYTKDNNCIEDFLAYIGAKNSAFSVMNSKIVKELRNTANRVTNCDQANINKTVEAAKKYCVAIEGLISMGMLDELPNNLQEMANKRLEYDSLNFNELGKKFNPPISKSGVYHRLEKILEFYNSALKLGDKE